MNTLPIAEHGEFQCDSPAPYEEGTVARLHCHEGFASKQVSTSLVISDQGQLQWQPPSARCVPVLNTLPVAHLGYITTHTYPPYEEGTLANIECQEGFFSKFRKQSTLIWKDDTLQWDPPSLACHRVTYLLPLAERGKFIVQDIPPYAPDTTAKLQCDEGYASRTHFSKLFSNHLNKLKWDPPFVKCHLFTETLPTARHGEFFSHVAPPYMEGDQSFLLCDDFYASKTLYSQLLSEKGQLVWNPSSVECEPVLHDLPQASNGHFISQATFPYFEGTVAQLQCEEGFLSQIQSSQLILEKGQLVWDPPFVPCKPVLDNLPDAVNGHFITDATSPYVEGTIAQLQCKEGFGSHFQFSQLLLENDQLVWDPSFVQCEPVLYELPDALNGHFTPFNPRSPYFEGTVAYLKCNIGFGSNIQTSYLSSENDQLVWNPPFAECEPAFYDLPEALQGRFFVIKDVPYPYLKETIALLECDDGYASNITFSQLQWEKGQFYWDPPWVKCQPALYDLPDAQNGQLIPYNHSPYFEGTAAHIKCDKGHGWGEKVYTVITLKEGHLQWDPPFIQCFSFLNYLPIVNHGRFTSNQPPPYRKGGIATLTCDTGYTSPITQSIIKESQGKWVWDPPKVSCQPLPSFTTQVEKVLFGVLLMLVGVIFYIWVQTILNRNPIEKTHKE